MEICRVSIPGLRVDLFCCKQLPYAKWNRQGFSDHETWVDEASWRAYLSIPDSVRTTKKIGENDGFGKAWARMVCSRGMKHRQGVRYIVEKCPKQKAPLFKTLSAPKPVLAFRLELCIVLACWTTDTPLQIGSPKNSEGNTLVDTCRAVCCRRLKSVVALYLS